MEGESFFKLWELKPRSCDRSSNLEAAVMLSSTWCLLMSSSTWCCGEQFTHLSSNNQICSGTFLISNLLWISNSRVLTCCNLDIFIVFVVACFLNVMSFSSVSIQNTHLLWLCFFKCKAKHYIASSMVWFYCYLIFHSYCFKFIQLSVPSWYFFCLFFCGWVIGVESWRTWLVNFAYLFLIRQFGTVNFLVYAVDYGIKQFSAILHLFTPWRMI